MTPCCKVEPANVREARGYLHTCAVARGKRARRSEPPTGDEISADEACLRGGDEHTRPRSPESLEPSEHADDLLERLDSVAQARSVLVAAAVGEITQLRAQAGECERGIAELLLRRSVERPASQSGARAAAERAEHGWRLRANER